MSDLSKTFPNERQINSKSGTDEENRNPNLRSPLSFTNVEKLNIINETSIKNSQNRQRGEGQSEIMLPLEDRTNSVNKTDLKLKK